MRQLSGLSPLLVVHAGVLAGVLAGASGCALRSPHIAELRSNPALYQHRTVAIEGVVTTSWGVPLVPIKLYKVDDGTGELTVVSQGGRTPTRGARVRVKGRVDEVAVVGGQAVGLHLAETSLRIRR
jgi:hypothetical protein